jgi:hypothetical protein
MSRIDQVLYPAFQLNPADPSNIGYVPQIQVPQLLQQEYLYIVSAVKIYLSNNAARNPARTFMFNVMAANDWFNKEFDGLIAQILDYTDYLLVSKIAFNMSEAIQKSIDEICIYTTSYFIISVPIVNNAMISTVGYHVIADCHADINRMNNTFSIIENMKNNSYRPNMNQNQYQHQQYTAQQHQQNAQRHTNQYREAQPNNGFPREVNTNSAFNAVPAQSAFSIASNTKRVPDNTASVQNTPPAQSVKPEATVEWYPNVAQFNPPAYKTNEQMPYVGFSEIMTSGNGGIVNTFPVVKFKEVNLVDRKAHTLVDKIMNNIQPKQSVLDDIKKVTTKNASYLSKSDMVDGSFINTQLSLYSTLDEAIKKTKIASYISSDDAKQKSIVTNFAALYNPVVTGFDIDSRILDSFFSELGESLTFDNVKTCTLQWLNSNDNVKAYIGVHVDKLFTDFINKMITNKLSFSELSIDSFVEDWDSLKDYLNDHSKMYLPAIEKHEGELIKSLYQHTTTIDELSSEMSEEVPTIDENGNEVTISDSASKTVFTDLDILESIGYNNFNSLVNNIFYRLQLVTITNIALTDAQLGISMYDGLGSVVTSRLTPDAYQILDYLFSYYETKLDDVPPNHYLVTSDNVVYEVHLGLLNDDVNVYLINKHVI